MTPPIDAGTLADLQASTGADFVAELIETFAEEAPQLLLELRTAQAEGAGERFRRASHALKSNGNTFGALRFAEMARALEIGGLPVDAGPVEALADEFQHALAMLRTLAAGGAGRG